jgi:leucyl aminopeptidase
MNVYLIDSPTDIFCDILIPVVQAPETSSLLESICKRYELQEQALKKDFRGEAHDLQMHYLSEGRRLFLLGLGEKTGFGDILKRFKSFSFKQQKKEGNPLCLDLSLYSGSGIKMDQGLWLEAAVNGLSLGRYVIGSWKTDNGKNGQGKQEDKVYVVSTDQKTGEYTNRGSILGDVQKRIMDLVNAPGNQKTPRFLAEWAANSAERYGIQAQIFDQKAAEKLGLHALLAVGKGSECPPYFVLLEYHPETTAKGSPHIGLVGKGVTFDTGGISLKNSTNLHYMKSDMGGAAAVFGAVEAAARLQLPIKISAAIPLADNAIGERAFRPGDVIQSYSGRTIEILDTDAEGRLILADGLHYLKRNYSPDILINLATLTGSSVRTFGYHCAALFSNNDELSVALRQAGDRSGERLWPLPLWDDYKEDIQSDMADVRNFSGKPIAGAISAAKFLEYFIDEHPRWAHLDIAGVAFGQSELSVQKSASGFGVRLLIDFFRSFL